MRRECGQDRPLPRVQSSQLCGMQEGLGMVPPLTPTNKGLNLKLQQEACRLDFREAQRV